RFAMMEYRAKPGNEPPPHVHEWEDEFYHVLDGSAEFHCGAERLRAIAGADGLFGAMLVTPLLPKIPRIGQSIPIVAETEQIADRRNSREIKSAIF
ncbi:MAG: cupin domain-containing protein, partial [Hyphomicrobiales bacterium]|nr:cupin domain-containing protein [Hyphomicrobiales bacterium]